MGSSIEIPARLLSGLVPRAAIPADKEEIFVLYKKVSRDIGGIARVESEITEDYVDNFIVRSRQSGIELVIEHPADKNRLIAEIHCCKLLPKVFEHVLSELTIVVDPLFQNQGIGRLLITRLLDTVSIERADILRIELIARETNARAIGLYKKMGFLVEGRYENRIKSGDGNFEADIPMGWFSKNRLKGSFRDKTQKNKDFKPGTII